MIYAIAVHGAPYAGTSHQHALAFSQALIDAGHQISRVFLYHEAVYAALSTPVAPAEEQDVTAEWQAFGKTQDVELCVCIASGSKRGVLDAGEARRQQRPADTLASGFQIVGLGQLIEAIASSDRYVEFPA